MPPRRAKGSAPRRAIRTVEAAGASKTGWDEAISDAVKRSKQKVVVGFEVVRFSGELREGRIATYRVVLKVAYRDEISGP